MLYLRSSASEYPEKVLCTFLQRKAEKEKKKRKTNKNDLPLLKACKTLVMDIKT